jgi:hypothetical protein
VAIINPGGVRLKKVGGGEGGVANHHEWNELERGHVEHAIV